MMDARFSTARQFCRIASDLAAVMLGRALSSHYDDSPPGLAIPNR